MAIKAEWSPVPYVSSFQRGRLFRNGMPLETAWSQLARFGTVESLEKICEARGISRDIAIKASLRIHQAAELRRASRGTSILSRPLLLYYSALNMTRAFLLATSGQMGGYSHGLNFVEGANVLDAGAKISRSGTFVSLAHALGLSLERATGKASTLHEFLAHVPELSTDCYLLGRGASAAVRVRVNAYFDPGVPARLHFMWSGPADAFESQWTTLFPTLKDSCRYCGNYSLEVISPLNDINAVSDFCYRSFDDNLYWSDEPIWWIVSRRSDSPPWTRLSSYLAALFILASVVRYQPELLSPVAQSPTDIAYVLTSFMDHAERLLPQMILGLAVSPKHYFI